MPPYSARNKVPTIQKLGEELAQRLNLQKADASKVATGKDQEKLAKAKAASRRRVVDPTTKNTVLIQDVDGSFEDSIRKPTITVPNPNALPAGTGEKFREMLDELAPPEADPNRTKDLLHHSRKKDVIYHPVPIADLKKSFYALDTAVHSTEIGVIVATIFLNGFFLGWGVKSVIASVLAGIIVACGIHLWLRNIQEDANAINWDSERQRAVAATESLLPESVEWMNTLVGIVWKLINPEMFAAMADTLEDVMQASVPPALIQNVRVSSIGLGDEAFKILSLRALPSAEGDDTAKNKVEGTEMAQEEKDDKKEQRELEGEDDPDMRYYNLEMSFAYNAIPATGVIGKAKNLHLEIIFYLGIQGLVGIPLPIFVELNGIIGTVRLRFQLTPNAPFLKNVTFTFMGLPKIDASAVPLTSKGINVLDLPLISGFVNSSIAAALDIYVAPKSLIMDMSKILQGDAVKKETDAVGLIYIKIKRAEGIAAQDKSGKSDPFITLAYSEFGKPMYCSRIIEQDLNPIWNEQTCLLVYQDQLTAGEKLSVELWDSDLITSDDVVGKVQFDLRDLIKNYTNKITEREDGLEDKDGKELPGKLYWDIGYFPRAEFKASMKTDGKNVAVPKEIRDRPEFDDDKGVVTTQQEIDVTTTPPDPSLPSGICSIIIHQVENLEIERPSGSFGNYKPWTPAQITGENTDEESDNLPSSYCTILQNDELVFKTRTKVKSSTPIFNAQTERFVRDWRNAVFTVTCRNSMHREHDPVLGAVTLKLSEVLLTSSQSTAIYALDGGMGYGRITISVLFRSVGLTLPKPLLGWDLGSVEILGDKVSASGSGSSTLSSTRIALHSDVGKGSISRRWLERGESADRVAWDMLPVVEGQGTQTLHKHRVLVPVRRRYQTPLRFEFFKAQNRKAVAYAVAWLCDLEDNKETSLELPIYKGPLQKRVTQNYLPAGASSSSGASIFSLQTTQTGKSSKEDREPEVIGTLHITLRFKDGMDFSHTQWLKKNDDRETFESWRASVAEGYRTRIVKRETPETVKELLKKGKVVGDNVEMSDAKIEGAHIDGSTSNLAAQDQDSDDDSGDDDSTPPTSHDSGDGKHPDLGTSVPKRVISVEVEQEYDPAAVPLPDDFFGNELSEYASDVSDDDDDEADELENDDDPEDLRFQEDFTDSELEDEVLQKRRQKADKRIQKADLYRKQRGIMNIKGVRHLKFAKDEAKVLGHKIKSRFSMKGREPGVETEL